MLAFRKITIEDKAEIEQYTALISTYLCEHCFVDLYIWKDHYDTEICFENGFLFVRCKSFPDEIPLYLAPIGQGDLRAAVALLQQDAAERGVPFLMTAISEGMLPIYQETFNAEFDFVTSENSADYIYLSEKLQTLSGKKLQSKRNLVNRFLADYEGRWCYVPISSNNTKDAYAFHLEWCKKHGCRKNLSFMGETCAIKLALDHFSALNLCGGILLLDNQVIAFTLGCRAREDLYVVQIEKADSDISGAYQMINQQFVRANCTEVQYVNREEDLGIEGLRKAKKSYYPAFYGQKYTAVLKKEPTV